MKKGLLALMALAAISQEMSSTRKEERYSEKEMSSSEIKMVA